MGLISAVHLEGWAAIIGARYKFGELLRKLIHAGIPLARINYIHFLANEATQLSGWDGLLDCLSEIPWIPNGRSVWELGTNADARGKIRNDFAIRRDKELPDGWSRGTTTYVAVTLRKLDDITALETELKHNSPWYDVKIYDASQLEEWVERFPSVETWLQEQSVGPPASIKTLERTWREWSDVTHPSISTELVLADREKASQELIECLKFGEIINVQADSPDEVVAFVYAAIAAQQPEFREHFFATSIIIDNKHDLDRMKYSDPQCIILCPPLTEKSRILSHEGHIVINALGNSSPTQKIDIRLNKPRQSNFKQALINMGIAEENAYIEACACGTSPSVWRVWNRIIEGGGVCLDIPEWAKIENANVVIPAILLGGFSDLYEGDKRAVELITGKTYEEYRDQIDVFISTDNPLFIKIADAYIITAPPTAFALIVNNITQSHMQKFSEIAHIVFSETDPVIRLDPGERPYAALRTEGIRHSNWLRDGLAGSLLRVVVIGKRLEDRGILPGHTTCQSFVDQIIRSLPGLSEDWRLIASLRDQLPVLAEAAPIPFLDALEVLLRGEPDKILPIFNEGHSFWGHVFYTGSLWALETLAWEPKYLGRIGLILSMLAKIDPGGKLSNRPINSLREIFLAWHPSTNANLKQRLQILDLILERNPEVGWALLMALMPSAHQISNTTHEPTWREFGRSSKEPLTNLIVWEAYQHYVERAIFCAGKFPDRWKQLIGFYSNVSLSHQHAIEDGLSKLLQNGINQESRIEIWETLRGFINRQLGFPEASWALPIERLDQLISLMELFAPQDPINKFAWLFNDYYPDIPFSREDIKATKIELEILRKNALTEILKEKSFNTLLMFIEKVAYPGFIVNPVLQLITDMGEILFLFDLSNQGSDKQRLFAQSLSSKAYDFFGKQWTDLVLCRATELNWPPELIVNVVKDYPDTIETFELIQSLGFEVEHYYWKVRRGWIYSENSSCLMMAISKFLWVGRALDILTLSPGDLLALGSEQILQIMDQALKELNEGKRSQSTSDISYWIEKMLDLLRKRGDIEKVEIAKREYAYLPLLTRGFQKTDFAVHDLLASDPKLFISIICDLYKPSSSKQSNEHEGDQPSDQKRARAEFAWHLLQSWNKPPGLEHEGQVNSQKLREWVEEVRSLAADNDRSVVTDLHIGHVLYYYPVDPSDSVWPHIELRRLLEELQCIDIERGIETEQHNARGVTTKDVFEGGKQERELAQKWRSWADIIELRWVRTKNMLERIAASWDAAAIFEDERAEKDRIRFS